MLLWESTFILHNLICIFQNQVTIEMVHRLKLHLRHIWVSFSAYAWNMYWMSSPLDAIHSLWYQCSNHAVAYVLQLTITDSDSVLTQHSDYSVDRFEVPNSLMCLLIFCCIQPEIKSQRILFQQKKWRIWIGKWELLLPSSSFHSWFLEVATLIAQWISP